MVQDDKLGAIAQYMGMGLLGVKHAFNYISPADGAIVFCREDPAVAQTAAALYKNGRVNWLLLTGGIGKDSGEKSREAGSEAVRQGNLLLGLEVPSSVIYLDPRASNGAENSRFGIDEIVRFSLPHASLILVVHPRNARRVYATHTKIAREEKHFSAEYQVVCINDPFDPENPAHRKELLSELLRVADWPAKGWSDPQKDLPEDLVAWARGQLAS